MRKWLNDLNTFGRPFYYACGVFATVIGAYWLLHRGLTLLGAILELITIGSGLTILVQTRRGAIDSPVPRSEEDA
jgi:hypothetical protein